MRVDDGVSREQCQRDKAENLAPVNNEHRP